MAKKVVVISLGGSLIVPGEIDTSFLKKFKSTILKNKKDYKFVIVTGGGSIARKYISALREIGKSNYLQNLIGISITRTNARFLSYLFSQDSEKGIPHDMKDIKNLLQKDNIIFCGALRYEKNNTSDGTAAKLAAFLDCDFINLTNINGLYNKNPKTHKDAKFIPYASWKEFSEMASKIPFRPGQHFVLDQKAAKIIMKHKIKTYIIGNNMKNLDSFLNGKKFDGTIISG